MARRTRKIYDNDGTVVTETTGISETVSVPYRSAEEESRNESDYSRNTVKTTDILDSMAGYLMPRFRFYREEDGHGECMLCHKETSYAIRKLCVDCMEKNAEIFYEKAKRAIENHEDEIII